MSEKTKYIGDLKAGMELQAEPFLLHDVVRRQSKDGRPFLLATLRDRTGQISGVFWDVPLTVDVWVKPGLAVLLSGRVSLYKDAIQVNINDLARAAGLDLAVFLPASRRPRAEMLAELRDDVTALAEPWQTLAGYLLLEGELAERFANAPAARSMHHAFVGGLLEHTLSMATVARFLSRHYPHVDGDLLLCGVLLHDLGKAYEYALADGFAYSEDGRLVGHIVRGIVLIEQAASQLDFPAADLQQLVHLIASHHGTTEWGSPVVPKTLEAVLLHQIDLLDSRIGGFMDHVGNDGSGAAWTARRSEMFGTELRRPDDFSPAAGPGSSGEVD
ncbi:MAG: HD domain-containing protein [Anaerolineales bacterium]|nr:HD domain-containing protein [Anaerolineales bacterium]